MKKIFFLVVTLCTFFILSCTQPNSTGNGKETGGTESNIPFLGTWQSDYTKNNSNGDPVYFHASITFDSLGKYEYTITAVDFNTTGWRKGTFTYDTNKITCTVLESNVSNDPVVFDYSLNNNILYLKNNFSEGNYTK